MVYHQEFQEELASTKNETARFHRREGNACAKARRVSSFPVTKPLEELASALRERLSIIADEESRREPGQHTERLRFVSERIERLERTLPAQIDPQLRHFLQRRSYSKALELLEHGL